MEFGRNASGNRHVRLFQKLNDCIPHLTGLLSNESMNDSIKSQSTMEHREERGGRRLAMEHHWSSRCTVKHREANEVPAEHWELSGLKTRKDGLRSLCWEGKNRPVSFERPFSDGWKNDDPG
jgi:hypothetical protein